MGVNSLTFKKWPWAFMLSLILFFAFQSFLNRSKAFWQFCYFYSEPSSDDPIRLKAQLETMPQENKQKIFLIGSSQTREGFDINLLNKRFSKEGYRFYNLGVSGSGEPLTMYMILKSLLDKKPLAIVYMPYVGSFYSLPDFNNMKYYFQPRIIPFLIAYLGTEDFHQYSIALWDSFLGKVSWLFRYREFLKRITTRWIFDQWTKQKRRIPSEFAHNSNQPSGYFLNEIKKAQGLYYQVYPMTRLEKEIFVQLARMIKARGVKMSVVEAPTHPAHKNLYDSNLEKSFQSFMYENAKSEGFVYLSNQQLPKFFADDFVDFLHLNTVGRAKLSAALDVYIRRGILNYRGPHN